MKPYSLRRLVPFCYSVFVLPTTAAEMAQPNAQMKAVLDELAALDGKPINTLSAEDARKQPTPADAVAKLMEKKELKGPEKVGDVDDISIELGDHDVKGRVYQPEGDGPFPVIYYIHGGGWVIADLDTYDATPRSLANKAGAVVIAIHYQQAPEHKFPASHQCVYQGYEWVLKNGHRWKGNTKKVAIVGESAGGNMALATSMMAKEKGAQAPVHQVLVYPVADADMSAESYKENEFAKPLNAGMMKWFFDMETSKPEDLNDPRLSPLKAESLAGLPSTTVITAQIDPLRTGGEKLAAKLKADGVETTYKNYEGVTHEFFGMGAVVDEAKMAMDFAVADLKKAFAR